MKRFLFVLLFLPIFLYGQDFGTTTMVVKPMPKVPVVDQVVKQFLDVSGNSAFLTTEQKEWFYWTNFSRRSPRLFWDSVVAPLIQLYPELESTYSRSLKKDLYGSSSLPLLKPNQALCLMAQQHANSLASKKASPSHTSTDGKTFRQRMEKANVKRCAGENISFGPPNVVLALVLLFLDQGVPDLGHRKSLLNSSYTEMGIGIASYPNNTFMVVQDFSCDQN